MTNVQTKEQKSGAVAVILSFFLTGLGHIYLGQIGKAAGFFFGAVIFAFAFFPIGIGIWVWAMIDAQTTANKMNEPAK